MTATFTPEPNNFTSPRHGKVIGKPCAALNPWNAEIMVGVDTSRNLLGDGGGLNRAIVAREEPGSVLVNPQGFQVPSATPEVTIGTSAGTGVTGDLQVAVRKYRTRDGAHSDISPVYPPPAVQISITGTQSGQRKLRDDTSSPFDNSALAQGVKVLTTLGGHTVTQTNQTFQSVTLLLKRTGAIDTGDLYVQVFADSNPTGTPNNLFAGPSKRVPASVVSTSGFTLVTFWFDTPFVLEAGTQYWIVLQGTYTRSASAYVEWGYGDALTSDGTAQTATQTGSSFSWSVISGKDFILNVNPFGNVREHSNELDLTSASTLTITNLDDYVGDATFEDYDALQILVRSSSDLGNEMRVAQTLTLDVTQAIIDQSLSSFNQSDFVVPEFNRPIGSLTQVVSVNTGNGQRWAGIGRPGWDNYLTRQQEVFTNQSGVTHLNWYQADALFSGSPAAWYLGKLDGSDWLQGLSGMTDPTNYGGVDLNGYLLTVFKTRSTDPATFFDRRVPLGGVELFRGNLVTTTYGGVDYLYAINVTGVPPSNGLNVDDADVTLRAEIRRMVVGRCDPNVYADAWTVALTWADDDTGLADWQAGDGDLVGDGTDAMVAYEGFIGEVCLIGGTVVGELQRVEPRGTARKVKWCGQRYFPSATLSLESPCTNATVLCDQFAVAAESNKIYFGMGAADTWEGTSPLLSLALPVTRPIVGLLPIKGRLCAVTSFKEVFVIAFQGSLVDPPTLEDAAQFSIEDTVVWSKYTYDFTCAGFNSMVSDQSGNGYFAAGEGLFMLDIQEGRLITRGMMQEFFRELDPDCIPNIRAVLDPGHAFGPCIRFFGMSLRNDYRGDGLVEGDTFVDFLHALQYVDSNGDPIEFQEVVERVDTMLRGNLALLYFPNTGAWSVQRDLGNWDSACSAETDNGTTQVLFGGNSRLWLVAAPAEVDVDAPVGAFTHGRFDGASLYASAIPAANIGSTSFSPPADYDTISLRESDLPSTGLLFLSQFAGCGILCYKLADDDTWETAEVLYPTTTPGGTSGTIVVTLLLRPIGAWTKTTGATYNVVFGAIVSKAELPAAVAAPGTGSVEIEDINAVMQNDGTAPFAWPITFQQGVTSGGAKVTSTTTQRFNSTLIEELRLDTLTEQVDASFMIVPTLTWINPPNSHVQMFRLQLGVRTQQA